MVYPYRCPCGKSIEQEYPMGKNPREVPCPKCGQTAKRVYEGMSIAIKVGSSFARGSTFGEQMKAKNAAAGHRMKGRKPPVRLAGYKHMDGRVVEA